MDTFVGFLMIAVIVLLFALSALMIGAEVIRHHQERDGRGE